jgi:bifunctional UDP-N-acetylglucosamine pyrophosphorylase/glucosamine-1-phosphate N-acetyltransferase
MTQLKSKRKKKPARKAAPVAAAPMPLAVVILAAGQGKRMNSALPKVLQPLSGKPLLRHVLDTARTLSPASMCVVFGHGGEQVRAVFAADQDVQWALQAEQKGTGHAVAQAAPLIAEDTLALVLYGDVPLVRSETLQALLALAGPRTMALLTVMLDDPTGYGRVLRDARGGVKHIVEHKDATARERGVKECNTGVMAVPAAALKRWLARLRANNAQGEYYLTDIVAMAVRDRIKVAPLVVADVSEALGVNDKVQLAQVESIHRLRQAETLMRAGATLADPARIDVRGTLTVERDVFIDVNTVFSGRVVLGANVRIGPNCVLRDMTIAAGTEVYANCVLEEATVDENCRIGPFARLRPGTHLARDVHVGNFVEVKNSEIGVGSKANHLTYIGDARVGSGVNVGAGTITCNYDGANKWQTVIEDGVFVGSGSMLVAPVTIGAQATIGAGSTITQSAPPGKLTLARGRQVTIEKWERPRKQPRK